MALRGVPEYVDNAVTFAVALKDFNLLVALFFKVLKNLRYGFRFEVVLFHKGFNFEWHVTITPRNVFVGLNIRGFGCEDKVFAADVFDFEVAGFVGIDLYLEANAAVEIHRVKTAVPRDGPSREAGVIGEAGVS